MSLCVAKEIVRGDCLKSVLWESHSGMKKTKSKRNGSSVYDRTARQQSSRARFHPGFVSYHAECSFTWSETSGEHTVYLLESDPGGLVSSIPGLLFGSEQESRAWRVTERGRRDDWNRENKWIFERVKIGWLGKCPHVVRKWPSCAGLAPIWRDERPGVTDHHPPLLGCSCHSRQKLASNSASVARISAVIQQLGLHWASLALCETTAACVAYTVSLSSPITHQETIMNNRATF